MIIRVMKSTDLSSVKIFTDKLIGINYYSLDELAQLLEKSTLIEKRLCFSFVLCDSINQIFGVRLTYPPGNWSTAKGKGGLTPEKWGRPIEKMAYFQSLFIDPEYSNQGWGKKISIESISALRGIGAAGIVTHSWVESPNDSSRRYLRSLGFKKIESHPHFWKEVDYICIRCGKPCFCTAEEMVLEL